MSLWVSLASTAARAPRRARLVPRRHAQLLAPHQHRVPRPWRAPWFTRAPRAAFLSPPQRRPQLFSLTQTPPNLKTGPYLVEKSGDWLGWARPHPRELAVGVVRGAVWCVLYDHENYKRGLRFLPDVTKCKAEKGNIFSITVRDGTKYEFQPAPTSEVRFDA